MTSARAKSYVLVIVQLACITVILFSGVQDGYGLWSVIVFSGFALGAWAVLVMKLGRFSVLPNPTARSALIERGPYKYIRHPMYAAILLICFPITIVEQRILNWAAFTLLVVDLLVKLSFEENLLCDRFPEYVQYMRRTKRLVPWVW